MRFHLKTCENIAKSCQKMIPGIICSIRESLHDVGVARNVIIMVCSAVNLTYGGKFLPEEVITMSQSDRS